MMTEQKVLTFFILLLTICSTTIDANEYTYPCPEESDLYFFPCKCVGGDTEGIIIVCENANLASISQGLSNVRLPVSRLHFRHCPFRKLSGNLFGSLLLQRLYLEGLKLEAIEIEVFSGVKEHLKELYIEDAPLGGKIPNEALAQLKILEVLSITGTNLTSLEKNALPPLGKLKRLHLDNCGIESLHKDSLRGMNDLERIYFSHNFIKDLPRGVFAKKRNVRVLDLSHNNMTKLTSQYFSDLRQLTWCNMSNNAIPDFGRNPFARNTALGWLSLTHNLIKIVPSNNFRSMRSLRRLYLSDNKITKLARSAFTNMRRIGTIDLARNNITEVGYQAFNDLQYCQNINLAENQITTVQKHAFKDLFLIKINISHNNLHIFENESFYNTINITVFDLSFNNITKIPQAAFPEGRLSYMTEFRLQYNNISDLSDIPFNFPGIKILNVTYNSLVRIPRNTFPKLYELHTIDASNNKLEEINNGVFDTLFSIRYINLRNNNLETLAGSMFGSLPTLLWVDLSHNRINKIPGGTFSNLVSTREIFLNDNNITEMIGISNALNHLFIQNNNITKLRRDIWPQMNALLSLDLGNNSLGDSIIPGTFKNLNSLRDLNLRNNSIRHPPWRALTEMQTLQRLNFEENMILNLTKGAFGRLPTIFEINLSNNGLTNVSKYAFDGLLQLLTLNMSNNNISVLKNDVFRGLVSLRTLDLSHNKLRKVDNRTNGLFEDLRSVRSLNLSHNRFEIVSKKMFPYHKWIPYYIEDVDLSYNNMPIIQKNLLIGLQKVKKLNFSHNILNEIRPDVIGNLSKLEVLDLSYNNLEALGNTAFGRDNSLKEVYLRSNYLLTVPAEVIASNVNISIIDLRDNNFNHYDPVLMEKAIKGTQVRYNGNPLRCDCVLRPIRAWLSNYLNATDWNDVSCATPASLVGRRITEIRESEFRCSDRERETNPRYRATPDISFRGLEDRSEIKRPLELSWFVKTREDVAGFQVTLRNFTGGQQLVVEDLPYTSRRREYPGIPAGEYQVCVGTEDSMGELRPLKEGQCAVFLLSGATLLHTIPVYVLASMLVTFYIGISLCLSLV